MAGLNECTNGCMSVVLRSCFSYQVAAGSTTSEKTSCWSAGSPGSSRSSFPRGPRHAIDVLGRGRPGSRRAQRVVGAEQVLEEVLVALARGAEQVGPPDRQDAREVLGGVGVLGREGEPPDLSSSTTCSATAGPSDRLVGEVERVAVEGGVRRHPAHPGALRDHVGRRLAGEAVLRPGRRQRVGAELVVAELVGVQVPVRRLDHLPRRPLQSRPNASCAQPVIGRHFSWPT